MNIRVVILSFLVATSAGVAYWLNTDEAGRLTNRGGAQQNTDTQQPLLSTLADQAVSLEQVLIENASGTLFRARRQGDSWVADHLDEGLTFPVDTAALSELVTDLSDARVLERKTSKADNYPRLGVEALSAADAQSTLVTLSVGNQQWQLLIGNVAKNGLGNYARVPDQAESVLLDKVLTLPSSPEDWLQQQVLPFKAEDIAAVTYQNRDAAPFTLSRQQVGSDEWVLEPLDGEASLAYPGVLGQTVEDLVELRYQSVQPYRENEWQALESLASVSFKLVDDSEVFAYVTVADETGNHKIWFHTPDSPSWVSDWVFSLSDFQAQPYTKQHEDLLGSDDD